MNRVSSLEIKSIVSQIKSMINNSQHMHSRKGYSADFKDLVCRAKQRGYNITDLCKISGVCKVTIYKWMNENSTLNSPSPRIIPVVNSNTARAIGSKKTLFCFKIAHLISFKICKNKHELKLKISRNKGIQNAE